MPKARKGVVAKRWGTGVPRHVGRGWARGKVPGHQQLPSARSPENKLSSSQAQDQTLEEGAMSGWPAQNVGRIISSLAGAPSLFTDSGQATQL